MRPQPHREELQTRRTGCTSAVNLNFLSVLLQPRHRNFKFKTRTRKHHVTGAPYDSEVRIGGCREYLRTSESEHQQAFRAGNLRGKRGERNAGSKLCTALSQGNRLFEKIMLK